MPSLQNSGAIDWIFQQTDGVAVALRSGWRRLGARCSEVTEAEEELLVALGRVRELDGSAAPEEVRISHPSPVFLACT